MSTYSFQTMIHINISEAGSSILPTIPFKSPRLPHHEQTQIEREQFLLHAERQLNTFYCTKFEASGRWNDYPDVDTCYIELVKLWCARTTHNSPAWQMLNRILERHNSTS
ncbi:hypothetical protein BKA70DRAFT_1233541 [Coprinopsis sp. MPI-PUGE-AT-0042]|nr:hypothetical protein BKA70DRAFT_1233541 [Coprinopsis sp. MPI-PUGE-AT-0042]